MLAAAIALTIHASDGVATQRRDPIDRRALFEAIRSFDLRLATIGFRLARANAALCDVREPGIGLVLHGPAQYASALRAAATAHFGFEGPIGISGAVPGGPGAAQGIGRDETLVAIAGIDAAALPNETPTQAVNLLYDRVAAMPDARILPVALQSNGKRRTVAIQPVPVCRTRFEVELSDRVDAEADGRMVKLSSRLFQDYGDDDVAVLVAHELAHNILRHRARLDAAGVDRGLLAGFGRNAALFRQTELEADILSVHLLANASYPPRSAAGFWRRFGPVHAGGFLRGATHPGWRERAARMAAEADRIGAGTEDATAPAILSARNRALDGNWRALIAPR